MDEPVVLNEEIPHKFESYSNDRPQKLNTLDEPVIDTIRRDAVIIYKKIAITMTGSGDYDLIQKEWDLWGPLVISLLSASLCAFGTSGQIDEAFTTVFIGMWLGPLAIILNANLLGGKAAIMSSLCLIIYCSAPIMVLSFAVFLMNWLFQSFLINLLLGIAATAFTLRCSLKFFKSFVAGDRQLLSLYPVLLFYTFICIFIAMT